MSDITLYPPRNLPASPEDIWGGSQNTALGAYQPQNGAQPQPQPLKKLNRLLRGRWLPIIWAQTWRGPSSGAPPHSMMCPPLCERKVARIPGRRT